MRFQREETEKVDEMTLSDRKGYYDKGAAQVLLSFSVLIKFNLLKKASVPVDADLSVNMTSQLHLSAAY